MSKRRGGHHANKQLLHLGDHVQYEREGYIGAVLTLEWQRIASEAGRDQLFVGVPILRAGFEF